ncbi:hypothetical protein DY000_02021727 [Brassica cretica]|uniref:Uncharacterized protein n=1 Tax=Brassica cretica TaxID=69181 RepID=A0ABQ7E3V3_BRACR|nr:hypothetical protein DY000_02021727 [Brassica cretica]
MKGFPCRKFSISWKGARFQGPNSGFLLAGTRSVSLSGTRGSGSCLEAGGNDTGRGPGAFPYRGPEGLGPAWRLEEMIPGYFSPTVCPLFLDFVIEINSDLPASLVGGRVRPCRLFADPFSSPVSSFGEVSETDSEAIPMAPLKQRDSLILDDDPRSEIQEGCLKVTRRKYGIHSSVQMRSSLEFERAPDRGPGEIAIFEAYLIAGFRGIIPSLVAEVSSFLGFFPSQLTPLSWKTLMSIQVLGELYGLDTGVHEVLYSYYFAPLTVMPGFYHLQPRDGAPLVEEPSRGTRGNYPFGDNWTSRRVSSGILSWGSSGEKYVGYSLTFPWSALPDEQGGNIARLPASVLYDEYQQAGMRRRRPFYAPPPHLTRATPPTARIRPLPSRTAIGDVPLVCVQQRLLTELFLLRNRGGRSTRIPRKNIASICFGLKGRYVLLEGSPNSARGLLRSLGSQLTLALRLLRPFWEFPRSGPWDPSRIYIALDRKVVFEDPEVESNPNLFKTRRLHGDPKVLDNPGAFDLYFKGPYAVILGEATTGTCWDFAFYRSEAGHYRVPVLHAAFCRNPLSGLEGAGVGENPSARLCCFPRLEKQDIIRCSRTFALPQGQLYLVSPVLF